MWRHNRGPGLWSGSGQFGINLSPLTRVLSMAYIPPHLRNEYDSQSQADPSSKSLESLQNRTKSTSSPIYSLDDLRTLLECDRKELSTLTIVKPPGAEELDASERNLDEDVLRAIILHEGQHPEWKDAHRILCKSNLHVLRRFVGDREDQSDNAVSHDPQADVPDNEYPLFKQVPFMKKGFEFAGWWRIQTVATLAPRSAELVALFEKKFNKQNGRSHNQAFAAQRGKPKTRTEEAWRESLDREWAVVSLVQNLARKDRPELPSAQRSGSEQELPKALGVSEVDESAATVQVVDV